MNFLLPVSSCGPFTILVTCVELSSSVVPVMSPAIRSLSETVKALNWPTLFRCSMKLHDVVTVLGSCDVAYQIAVVVAAKSSLICFLLLHGLIYLFSPCFSLCSDFNRYF